MSLALDFAMALIKSGKSELVPKIKSYKMSSLTVYNATFESIELYEEGEFNTGKPVGYIISFLYNSATYCKIVSPSVYDKLLKWCWNPAELASKAPDWEAVTLNMNKMVEIINE